MALADANRIKPLETVTEIPASAKETLHDSFSKEAIKPWLFILGSTSLLYQYDEQIYLETLRQGRRWDLSPNDHTETKFSAFGVPLFRFPTDKGSTLYFLGDGWTHTAIAGSFLAAGYWVDATRPINTGYEIFHGMFVSTIFNQALKHSFGRETPNQSTSPRGKWRPFPSPVKYAKNTPKYDAMPSGHIMTATMTFTVIAENYPEYRWWLYPVEGVWLTALAFQMVNNGVHWASDYPLGIAMGYYFGKQAVRRLGHSGDEAAKKESAYMIYPEATEEGPTINVAYYF